MEEQETNDSRSLLVKMYVIPTCFKLSRINPVHNLWTIYPTPVITNTFERLVLACLKDVKDETWLYPLRFKGWSNRSLWSYITYARTVCGSMPGFFLICCTPSSPSSVFPSSLAFICHWITSILTGRW